MSTGMGIFVYCILLPCVIVTLYYYFKKKLRQWIAKIAREEIEKMH